MRRRRRRRMMSNLPSELVEEIISRVPVNSITIVRSTCKMWDSLFKDESFVRKHVGQAAASTREREFLIITGDPKLELISVNLHD
uniref:Putative F-box protein n=1 Tax=Noccaea caerulescens TaxID=107243 RepID=A0A1J3FG71_NOCCA